LKLSSYAFFFF
jgi:hypothetical protein